MKVKEAIAQAKALINEYYADEDIVGVRLEEVEFDEPGDSWLITLGISRPGVEPKSAILAQASTNGAPLAQTYKVLRIPNETSLAPSMKIRELHIEG